ncbi:hypothetical protein [Dyadobacter sp.]|uniref:hypothetical protein n=1 Tax=Dyadobacter sp. TaxID=1914288 RepID=UPI003F71EAC0
MEKQFVDLLVPGSLLETLLLAAGQLKGYPGGAGSGLSDRYRVEVTRCNRLPDVFYSVTNA